MNKLRILGIVTAWYAVGMLILVSVLFASGNASANTLSGTISNGETKTYDLTVQNNLMPVSVAAYWITLTDDNIDLVLKNPSGVTVATGDSLSTASETITYVFPPAGTYKLEVIGTDISASGSISFTLTSVTHNMVLSSSGGPAGALDWSIIIIIIVVIVAVIIVVLLVVMMRKKQPQQPMAPPAYGAQQPAQQYAYQQPQQPYAQPAPPQQYAATQAQVPQNCPYCGTKLDPNWLACPKCGARIRP